MFHVSAAKTNFLDFVVERLSMLWRAIIDAGLVLEEER